MRADARSTKAHDACDSAPSFEFGYRIHRSIVAPTSSDSRPRMHVLGDARPQRPSVQADSWGGELAQRRTERRIRSFVAGDLLRCGCSSWHSQPGRDGDSRRGDSPRGDSPRGDSRRGDSPRGDSPRGRMPGMQDERGGDRGPSPLPTACRHRCAATGEGRRRTRCRRRAAVLRHRGGSRRTHHAWQPMLLREWRRQERHRILWGTGCTAARTRDGGPHPWNQHPARGTRVPYRRCRHPKCTLIFQSVED
ncbi:hypothetical protein M2389_001985 [Microbacterium phyllosphaerae]|nr:hypothetical protein [Microbacterium phyllosphaerae]